METFFLDKYDLGMVELKRDLLYAKIPVADHYRLIDQAWNLGKDWAAKIAQEHGTTDSLIIAGRLGLKISVRPEANMVGDTVYYSEFYSGPKQVILYRGNIETVVKRFNLEWEQLKRLFVAHELFHYLEMTQIGVLSKGYQVVTLKFGPFRLTSGIRGLSEIGAHAFTKNLTGIGV